MMDTNCSILLNWTLYKTFSWNNKRSWWITFISLLKVSLTYLLFFFYRRMMWLALLHLHIWNKEFWSGQAISWGGGGSHWSYICEGINTPLVLFMHVICIQSLVKIGSNMPDKNFPYRYTQLVWSMICMTI